MGRIMLVTGGSRSGKSAYARGVAERLSARRAFVATCPILDDEMRRRVARHREARAGRGWATIEEPLDVVGALRSHPQYDLFLVDCLTLWINNLLHDAHERGATLGESDVAGRCDDLLRACAEREGRFIFVTNEVGWGIVPENALARRFRDCAGRCNQLIAGAAEAVALVACGCPLYLKGTPDGWTA